MEKASALLSDCLANLEPKVLAALRQQSDISLTKMYDQPKSHLIHYVRAYFKLLGRLAAVPGIKGGQGLSLISRIHAEAALSDPTYNLREIVRDYTLLRDQIRDGLREGVPVSEAQKAALEEMLLRSQTEAIELYIEGTKSKPTECHLLEVAKEAVRLCRAPDRINFQSGGDKISGFWNRDDLKKAILNMIENALEFGRPERPVYIKARKIRNIISLSVQNAGNFVPIEGSISGSALYPGIEKAWGIDLSGLRSMADAHQGRIHVLSSKDEGTIFTLEIPLKPKVLRN